MILLKYFATDLQHHMVRCRGRCELPLKDRHAPLSAGNLKTRIRRYYHENQLFYDLFWTDAQTFSMNYGFWYPETRKLDEAFLNQNRYIARVLEVCPADTILEAGCGTGGTSVWLARHYGARVVGITLSENQARRAMKIAAAQGVADRVCFYVMDFANTAFPDGCFSKIFASESVCYAPDKGRFLAEAHRLLDRGGRLAVLDGFRTDRTMTEEDKRICREWCHGWVLPEMASVQEFKQALIKIGFYNITFANETGLIRKSSARILVRGYVAYPIIQTLRFVGIATSGQVDHVVSSLRQHSVWSKDICRYGVFTARKGTGSADGL